jgi:hypothetical protein
MGSGLNHPLGASLMGQPVYKITFGIYKWFARGSKSVLMVNVMESFDRWAKLPLHLDSPARSGKALYTPFSRSFTSLSRLTSPD